MDRIARPHFTASSPPTSSRDPDQQRSTAHLPPGDTRNITARHTVPTGTDGTEGAQPARTDGSKNPGPLTAGDSGAAGTEYNAHMKGTAAPGSHSELFGLTPEDGTIHPPPGIGSGSQVTGMSEHEGSRNARGAGEGLGEGGKLRLVDQLNPKTDSTGEGKAGLGH